jgi:hypothetical protein
MPVAEDSSRLREAGEWHKLHPGEYEDVVPLAAGAMAGWCMAHGEDPPRMTDVFHAAFRWAVAEAFNAGYQARYDEEINHAGS